MRLFSRLLSDLIPITAFLNNGSFPGKKGVNMMKHLIFLSLFVTSLHGQDFERIARTRELEAAIEEGNLSKVKDLVKRGVDLNPQYKSSDIIQWFPLSAAADWGFPEIVEFLLKSGARADQKNRVGRTHLMVAAEMRWGHDREEGSYLEIAKLLLDAGADPHARMTHHEKSGGILAKGNGMNALFLAADHHETIDSVGIVKLLLEKKVDVNVKDDLDGVVPIMAAVASCNLPVVEMLIANGAEVNIKKIVPKNNNSLLPIAVSRGWVMDDPVKKCKKHYEILDLLLRSGVDIHGRNSNGSTAFMLAAERFRYRDMEILLEKGANVNDRDSVGSTAMMIAVQNPDRDLEIIRFLLEHKADPKMKSSYGKTAYDIARGFTVKDSPPDDIHVRAMKMLEPYMKK
jgi:ankyrin repeat protein